MNSSWDERYAGADHVYGLRPNEFLVQQVGRLAPGSRVLSLGEGEGRNAVFLAERGMRVTAVDGSAVGLDKARRLAESRGVTIDVLRGDLTEVAFPGNYEALLNVFCHLPSKVRRAVHARALDPVGRGGLVLVELYRPEQIPLGTGGPRDVDMLATLADLRGDFPGCEEVRGREIEREVVEGKLHTGRAAVVQLVMRKR